MTDMRRLSIFKCKCIQGEILEWCRLSCWKSQHTAFVIRLSIKMKQKPKQQEIALQVNIIISNVQNCVRLENDQATRTRYSRVRKKYSDIKTVISSCFVQEESDESRYRNFDSRFYNTYISWTVLTQQNDAKFNPVMLFDLSFPANIPAATRWTVEKSMAK